MFLRVLALYRNPESYVAGAAPLNRDGGRFSEDIDVFHDREDRVATAALDDASGTNLTLVPGYRHLPPPD